MDTLDGSESIRPYPYPITAVSAATRRAMEAAVQNQEAAARAYRRGDAAGRAWACGQFPRPHRVYWGKLSCACGHALATQAQSLFYWFVAIPLTRFLNKVVRRGR